VGRFPRAVCRRRLGGTAIAASTLLLLGGCGFSAGPSRLAPDAPSTMTVTSQSFGQGVLPQRYTCHGAKISPPLNWSGAPQGTKSYAIVVDDSDAPITPYIYWIVFDIPAATTGIQEGQLPEGARQADNSAGRTGYDPPCPRGHSHSYRFTVYALRSWLNLPDGASTRPAWTAIAAATIGRGRLTLTAKPLSIR
jgi:Raf kinase inhibitor-like YbhB/YbcL family protein